jgi:ABC-type uncharacterized transport system fused permease/ATPase subunit
MKACIYILRILGSIFTLLTLFWIFDGNGATQYTAEKSFFSALLITIAVVLLTVFLFLLAQYLNKDFIKNKHGKLTEELIDV